MVFGCFFLLMNICMVGVGIVVLGWCDDLNCLVWVCEFVFFGNVFLVCVVF